MQYGTSDQRDLRDAFSRRLPALSCIASPGGLADQHEEDTLDLHRVGASAQEKASKASNTVLRADRNSYTVYDDDHENRTTPFADRRAKETCEHLAPAHFEAGDAPKDRPTTMKVKVLGRRLQNTRWGNGYRSIHEVMREIEISTNCPNCGRPRGTPVLRRFCEDNEWYDVHVWQKPCGHLGSYPNLLIGAGNYQDQPKAL